jgi:hypothetical protein
VARFAELGHVGIIEIDEIDILQTMIRCQAESIVPDGLSHRPCHEPAIRQCDCRPSRDKGPQYWTRQDDALELGGIDRVVLEMRRRH